MELGGVEKKPCSGKWKKPWQIQKRGEGAGESSLDEDKSDMKQKPTGGENVNSFGKAWWEGRGQSETGHFQKEERKSRLRQLPTEIPMGITSLKTTWAKNHQTQLCLSSEIHSRDFFQLVWDILAPPETVTCQRGWKLTNTFVSDFGGSPY